MAKEVFTISDLLDSTMSEEESMGEQDVTNLDENKPAFIDYPRGSFSEGKYQHSHDLQQGCPVLYLEGQCTAGFSFNLSNFF